MNHKRVSVIIPAAGNATRMNGIHKTMYRLAGVPVLIRTLKAFQNIDCVGEIIAAVKPEDIEAIRRLIDLYPFDVPVSVVSGGSTRQESVTNALAASDARFDFVAIHDGARPLIAAEDIVAVFDAAFSCGAAALGVPVKDTVKLTENRRIIHTLPREKMIAIRTPQVFRKQLYLQGCEAAEKSNADYTDDCQLLEAIGAEIYIVYGQDSNIKVTTPSDLQVAEALLQENGGDEKMDIRVGHGYDVHRLVPGRKLVIGGVEIPHEYGLEGHSDADVFVHAVMDSLFGALAMGDIGQRFPDTDGAYFNIDSMLLLKKTVGIVAEAGYTIGNIDGTILAQAPKLAPYIEQMRQRVAEVCGVSPERISIKATTEEQLGFTGNKEGIAAHAVCLLTK